MPFPIIPAVALAGGIATLASINRSIATMSVPVLKNDGKWHHPAPALIIDGKKYLPTVSDGFKSEKTYDHRRHLGSDIDYARGKGELDQYDGLPDASRKPAKGGFFFPPDIPVRAARDGVIWWSGLTSRGHGVLIVHDKGRLETFYQHLATLDQDFNKGQAIAAGTVLGTQGYNPNGYKFRHLHFEIRAWDPETAHFVSIDPEKVGGKLLKNFPVEYEVEL